MAVEAQNAKKAQNTQKEDKHAFKTHTCAFCAFLRLLIMLDNGTKKRIDSARDILVGKVPDPKSQVEQITIAMIYKFMDDMDNQTEELGGKATFFAGKFKQYAWGRLLDRKLSGYERLLLYAEGIEKMNINENIPQLFRDIFKGAFLPYRDPETLNLFLKEINGFPYDHSERLGDAFEYLLSVLSSQGDAGQFRTPRHIIDFIVEIVDPAKEDTVLDPACGTAGFLISSYKHIISQNTKDSTGDLLTTDDKGRLMTNFCGYDISPDMVRLSLVNMYLHSFADPSIYEYDTLTSEDRWDERYDVIMANPPFMSPKGGIRPHSRFMIKAKRSEVLFVDYIAEHLNVHGRAGVIVPEGIIFQSQNAYKNLRKMLVEDGYLYAVISLPAGVFQPYSGVKTSILLMDKTLAKKTGEILFVKVSNDGFDLGAQRRPIDKNDLPQALKIVKAWKQAIGEGKGLELSEGDKAIAHIVSKKKIAESGDYNLSGDRYREVVSFANVEWPMVELGEVCEVISGQSPQGKFYNENETGMPFYQGKADFGEIFIEPPRKWTAQVTKEAYKNDILMSVRAPVGPVNLATQTVCIGRGLAAIRPNHSLNYLFLFYLLMNQQDVIRRGSGGSTFESINHKQIRSLRIPLPPLEVQEKIVAELDGYQKIIDGAKQIVENYKPAIKIDPDWPMVELKDADLEIIDGDRGTNYPKKYEFSNDGYCVFVNTKNVLKDGFNFSEVMFITKEKDELLGKGKLNRNDIVLTTRGTVGNVAVFDEKVPYEHIRINSGMLIFRPALDIFQPKYLFWLFQTQAIQLKFKEISSGSAQPQLPIRNLVFLKIPFPPLETQQKIVVEIEAERELVEANKKLIEIFEKKIKDKINEVWGE